MQRSTMKTVPENSQKKKSGKGMRRYSDVSMWMHRGFINSTWIFQLKKKYCSSYIFSRHSDTHMWNTTYICGIYTIYTYMCIYSVNIHTENYSFMKISIPFALLGLMWFGLVLKRDIKDVLN